MKYTKKHSVFNLNVHLVFVTKYRRKVFTKEILEFLSVVFTEICTKLECSLIEFNGEMDHVHLLVNYPPKIYISKLVNHLKGISSRYVRREKFSSITKRLWGDRLWTPSYFASSCGGVTLSIVKQYIEQQTPPLH